MSNLEHTYLGKLPIINPEKEDWYTIHTIPKRRGGVRIIEAPADWLKDMQHELLNKILYGTIVYSKNAFGCLPRRNIAMAAKAHVGKKTIFKIDLSNCFHHVTEKMIAKELDRYADISTFDKKAITYYTTNSRGVLPQGAPTSPLLCNAVMTNMYAALRKVAKSLDLTFSGYLDDLIFSGERAWRIKDLAIGIIENYGFKVNPKKITTMRMKREVLGVCVAPGSDHTRLPKKLRNKLRGRTHALIKQYENGCLDEKFYRETMGLLSFGVMANDKKAIEYHAQLKELGK